MKKAVKVVALAAAVGLAVVAVEAQRRRRGRKPRTVEEIVRELEAECATSTEQLRSVADSMVEEMRKGLADEENSNVKMLVSYVDKLPLGDEKGLFYALDLGGTNFRVLRVRLGGAKRVTIEYEKPEAIPDHLMCGTAEDLFDFIASELASVVNSEGNDTHEAEERHRELGFTFSFPVKQSSIASGCLIRWTKRFNIPEMIGRDVVEELTKALERKKVDIRVAALVNDTVGNLAAGRYEDEDVVLAVILGTGTNAAYVEKADSIRKSPGLTSSTGDMVINMEWGNFDSDCLPFTDYDRELDATSLNKGQQIYEKLISGMYLGDIVRRVLLKIAVETGIFGDSAVGKLRHGKLMTQDMSRMHHDTTPDLYEIGKILKEKFEITETFLETRKMVSQICDVIAKRGARLSAAGIVGVLKKLGRDTLSDDNRRTVVAIDGALYKKYGKFREYLESTLKELLGDAVAESVHIKETNDGSGIGAALLAACYSQH